MVYFFFFSAWAIIFLGFQLYQVNPSKTILNWNTCRLIKNFYDLSKILPIKVDRIVFLDRALQKFLKMRQTTWYEEVKDVFLKQRAFSFCHSKISKFYFTLDKPRYTICGI